MTSSNKTPKGFPEELYNQIAGQGYATPQQQREMREYCGSDVKRCEALYLLLQDLGMSHTQILPEVRQKPGSSQPLHAALAAVTKGHHLPAPVDSEPMAPGQLTHLSDSGRHFGLYR